MKTRSRKKRNRWLGGLRILVYMNTEKEQKKVRWFSAMRIVVIIWNIFTYIYHLEEIEMNILTNSIQHIVGMLIEYFIAGIYENSIIRINKFINKKTLSHKYKKTKRRLIKFLSFGIVFSVIYTVVYILRMTAIYLIGGEFQTEKAIIISTIAGFILGPVTGSLILWARNRRLKVKITKVNKAPEGWSFFFIGETIKTGSIKGFYDFEIIFLFQKMIGETIKTYSTILFCILHAKFCIF